MVSKRRRERLLEQEKAAKGELRRVLKSAKGQRTKTWERKERGVEVEVGGKHWAVGDTG
jgi:hypothetical protein